MSKSFKKLSPIALQKTMQTIETIALEKDNSEYAGRSKKQWIAWAKKEIKEYEKFIDFLEDK